MFRSLLSATSASDAPSALLLLVGEFETDVLIVCVGDSDGLTVGVKEFVLVVVTIEDGFILDDVLGEDVGGFDVISGEYVDGECVVGD